MTPDWYSLTGKRAFVAGASRGIGLAIAEQLAAAGAEVVLAARSIDKLQEHAARLHGKAVALDVTDSASIQKAANEVGDVDILVNVAGTNIRLPFENYSREQYDHLLQTNLHGLVELTQLIGGQMVARYKAAPASQKPKAKIIFIGSLTSLLGFPYLSIYGITKGAIGELTRCLAAEWGQYGIQVNCIAPGFIETDLNREMWKAGPMRDWLRGSQANPEMGTAADVAPLAVFLAGAGADYITGQVIPVDGGHTTTGNWPFKP